MITIDGHQYKEVIENSQFSQIKLDYFAKQGWGYADSYFVFDPKRKMCGFGGSGNRYLYAGEEMPNFFNFAIENLTFDFDNPKKQPSRHGD